METNQDWLVELFNDTSSTDTTEIDAIIEANIAEITNHKPLKPNCPKCSGTGRIAYFSHIKGGECFKCSGTGFFKR